MTEVRCPHCGTKIAERLDGILTYHCPKKWCGKWSVIDNRVKVVI